MKASENSSLTTRDAQRLEHSDMVLVTSFFFSLVLFVLLITTPLYFHLFFPTEEQKRLESLEKLAVEHCVEGACLHGGICSANLELNYTCACPSAFKGRHCQLEKSAEVELNTTNGVSVREVWLSGKRAGQDLLRSPQYHFMLPEDTRCVCLHLINNATLAKEAGFKIGIKYSKSRFEESTKCSTKQVTGWNKCSTDLSAWPTAAWEEWGWWISGEKEVWCRTNVKL